jgi:hypothetical protein
MSEITRWAVGAAAMGLAIVATSAFAQERVRVRGTIEQVAGNVLSVKTREGQEVKVKLADNARVLGLDKASIDDVKKGSYVGVSAMPQTDGSQKALHVHIFPEAMRGTAEGFGPWDARPNSTMTNATVDTMVTGTDGRTLTVKYKDGEKKIIVPPDVPIVKYIPGNAQHHSWARRPDATNVKWGLRPATILRRSSFFRPLAPARLPRD